MSIKFTRYFVQSTMTHFNKSYVVLPEHSENDQHYCIPRIKGTTEHAYFALLFIKFHKRNYFVLN